MINVIFSHSYVFQSVDGHFKSLQRLEDIQIDSLDLLS